MGLRELTEEELKDLRHDAEFTQERVGAPGCKVRERAALTLVLIEFYEKHAKGMRQ
jgi:hypothetical protein